MRCVIFAGGVIEDTSFIDAEEIAAAELVICADSGYRYAQKLGITPHILMGDFDSYTGALPEDCEIMRSVPEKDDTDTMLAVRTAISRGCDEIHLYGALGARFDHTYANVQTLVYAHENGCSMTIYDSDNEMCLQAAGERRYPRRDGWYFSLFALTETALIEDYFGVQYPLRDYTMTTAYPIGVSNRITADEAVLKIGRGLVLVVRSRM